MPQKQGKREKEKYHKVKYNITLSKRRLFSSRIPMKTKDDNGMDNRFWNKYQPS